MTHAIIQINVIALASAALLLAPIALRRLHHNSNKQCDSILSVSAALTIALLAAYDSLIVLIYLANQ